jgi:ankyrin repeat protein
MTKGAIMSTRSLPARPDLGQLKLQARELLREHGSRSFSAAARVATNHPRMKGRDLKTILDHPLVLADAQLVLAREYGFESWAKLKERVERGKRIGRIKPHAHFGEALEALRGGDIERLRGLIGKEPDLITARTNLEPPYGYFSGATLLHHVAGNPGWGRPLPSNIVEVARLLLELGAHANAITLGSNGGTTMGLVITSKQASDANVSGPLIDLLLAHGAKLDLKSPADVVPDWRRRNVLDLPLANHAPRAAEKLIELGAKVDVCAAAALGRMDLLGDCFDDEGRLRSRPRRGGKLMSERDAIGLAALFAYVNRRAEAVDFLLEKEGNWNMTGVNNGAILHRAAWDGDLAMVRRLVAKGADMTNRDNPFNSTPLSWAQHNKQQQVFDWMRAHCAIDLHKATGFDLREHIEARLREDPSSVNHRIDHWDIPQCTPLHWAAWTSVEDVDGRHPFDLGRRKELVELLLRSGADPNAVAGNGLTPLDVADAAHAEDIAKLLMQHGGKRASEL